MAISFATMPSNLRTPGVYVEVDSSLAVQGPALKSYRALLVGQRLSSGSVAAGIPTRLSNASQARSYFGRASMLERMAMAWFANNPVTEVWAIALDDNGAGTFASGTLTVTGTATASGTLNVYVAGQRVQVAVTAGDGQNTVAASINAAVNASLDLPVTSGVASNVVTLTARHKGELGNAIDVRIGYYDSDLTPAGIAVAVSGSGYLTSGATNPTVAAAITAMADVQYDVIAHPYIDTANLLLLKSELDTRWGPLEMIEGHAVSAMNGTFSALTAFGAARNDAHLSVFGVELAPPPPYERAASRAALIAYHGAADPARPFQTLAVRGADGGLELAPRKADRFTQAERNLLLFDGIATESADDSDGTVRIDRAITTYQTSASGAEDMSFLDVTTVLTLAYLRYSLRNRWLTRYPRHKLSADSKARYAPGQAVVTPKSTKLELLTLFSQWQEQGLVEDIDQFKRDMIVEVNASDPSRLDIQISPNIVNGLVVTAATIKFVL